MSLNSFIMSILSPLGVPVRPLFYNGSASTYITFFEYNQNGALHADDEEKKTHHFIQVDIWSDGDYINLANQVRENMKQAGFIRTFETEVYDYELDNYHKVFRFRYTI